MDHLRQTLPQLTDWSEIHLPEIESFAGPVFLRAQNLAAREIFQPHTHRWHQFVYATSGTLVVILADAWYVITPEQAIWVPAGVLHTTGTMNGAAFRNLYVACDAADQMPQHCAVYAISDLMKALIGELEQVNEPGGDGDYAAQVAALTVAQLKRLPALDFHLPWPQSAPLRRLCEALYANPADERGLETWGAMLGMSTRTIARRFERECGITLRAWRHKLRLFLAVEWLCAGRNITEIALDLGYASTSAFSYMFRQEMGYPPSAWSKR